MTTQAAAATTVLAVGTYAILGKVAVLTCLATGGYLRFRRGIGGNGADQLTFMVLVTFALVLLAGAGPMTQRAGDVFIAAQLCLAYFASGFAKLVSPVWRSGQAIVGILATEGFGMPSVAARLATLRWLAWLMCWTVILWECTFPVVLIAPPPVTLALLAFGVVFHGGCAIAMGLNRFAWAFCGCYSAVLVVTTTNL
ncbi:hypothetical protein [Catellatospora tritici]|uniref:hypothetical protein n=1 Tax=Catellatospora tritici TaxID=2851566 RepID=UPI001C2DCD89|nr:hypothetical protein [Catellatospora tritici]MBV1855726.1 hypothetical protein [Catellatospora tritici]